MIESQIQELRNTLDSIDESIILLLGQRYNICRKVGAIKKKYNIPMMQSERVAEVINKVLLLAKNADIPEAVIKKVYEIIIEGACNLETEIIEN